jgi:hypothetical protein
VKRVPGFLRRLASPARLCCPNATRAGAAGVAPTHHVARSSCPPGKVGVRVLIVCQPDSLQPCPEWTRNYQQTHRVAASPASLTASTGSGRYMEGPNWGGVAEPSLGRPVGYGPLNLSECCFGERVRRSWPGESPAAFSFGLPLYQGLAARRDRLVFSPKPTTPPAARGLAIASPLARSPLDADPRH